MVLSTHTLTHTGLPAAAILADVRGVFAITLSLLCLAFQLPLHADIHFVSSPSHHAFHFLYSLCLLPFCLLDSRLITSFPLSLSFLLSMLCLELQSNEQVAEC